MSKWTYFKCLTGNIRFYRVQSGKNRPRVEYWQQASTAYPAFWACSSWSGEGFAVESFKDREIITKEEVKTAINPDPLPEKYYRTSDGSFPYLYWKVKKGQDRGVVWSELNQSWMGSISNRATLKEAGFKEVRMIDIPTRAW